ncbi:MAG: monovalent cation/H+ antiporter subunit D family protein [Dehalococcoidia bacterium]|nr:MAG: monovalent cation/H+ antiporter subunit D family protein [Dehalococcoidia bacterium]
MALSHHFVIYVVITPLLVALLIPIVNRWKKNWIIPLTSLALVISLTLSILLLPNVLASGYLSYHMGSWEPPFGIEVRIDFLGLFMMILILIVTLVVAVYSRRQISSEIEDGKTATYYALYLIFSASMLGFCAAGDIFNMFVFFELTAVTSYALVAIPGTGRAIKASIKYLLMGAPASILILFAIGLLYSVTGTLNMADLADKITSLGYGPVVIASYVIFITGFAVKAALFPLHIWLPDAHSIAPSPISALLSGLFVKMGVFGVIRLVHSVYSTNLSFDLGVISGFLTWVAVAAVIYGSIMAIMQRDLKMMIAYSTVAHVGYILIGIGLTDVRALMGSMYHIMDHGLAKACFFLCAGSIIYQSGYRKIDDLKGASRQMPLTCAAFALASLSIIGVPPTAGFISKWYLVWGSLNADNVILGVVILLGSVMAAIYCFRILYYMYFLPPLKGNWQDTVGEAPALMVGTSWILAIATLVLGIVASLILPNLQKAIEVFYIS